MREILFRGKRTDNREWLYGYYFFEDNNLFSGIKGCHYIHPKGENQAFSVMPETVGQYTGLTDKNGTKIFEGDILQRDDECKWVVSFHKVMFAAQRYKYPIHRLSTQYWCKHSVIGNIHDNPELAKEKGRG